MTDLAEPYADTLPALSAQQSAARRAVSRWRGPGLDTALEALDQDLTDALGHRVAIDPGGVSVSSAQHAIDQTHDAWTTPITHRGSHLGVLALDLAVALALLDACFERQPSAARRPRPLSDLERGLLLAQLTWIASRLEHHLGLALSLPLNPAPTERPTDALSKAAEVVNIEICLSIGEARGEVRAHIPAERFVVWLGGLDPPEAQRRQRCEAIADLGLPASLTLELARVRIEAEAISALEPGGLLLGWCTPDTPIELTLRQSDRPVCLCRSESSDPHAPGVWRAITTDTQEIPMSDGSKPSVDVEALPVEVTLSLGEVKLPIGDLVSLRPGDVLPLDGPLHRPVSLLAGGRELATGELVRVGGALGVRITEVPDQA